MQSHTGMEEDLFTGLPDLSGPPSFMQDPYLTASFDNGFSNPSKEQKAFKPNYSDQPSTTDLKKEPENEILKIITELAEIQTLLVQKQKLLSTQKKIDQINIQIFQKYCAIKPQIDAYKSKKDFPKDYNLDALFGVKQTNAQWQGEMVLVNFMYFANLCGDSVIQKTIQAITQQLNFSHNKKTIQKVLDIIKKHSSDFFSQITMQAGELNQHRYLFYYIVAKFVQSEITKTTASLEELTTAVSQSTSSNSNSSQRKRKAPEESPTPAKKQKTSNTPTPVEDKHSDTEETDDEPLDCSTLQILHKLEQGNKEIQSLKHEQKEMRKMLLRSQDLQLEMTKQLILNSQLLATKATENKDMLAYLNSLAILLLSSPAEELEAFQKSEVGMKVVHFLAGFGMTQMRQNQGSASTSNSNGQAHGAAQGQRRMSM